MIDFFVQTVEVQVWQAAVLLFVYVAFKLIGHGYKRIILTRIMTILIDNERRIKVLEVDNEQVNNELSQTLLAMANIGEAGNRKLQ